MRAELVTFATPHYDAMMRRLAHSARPWFDKVNTFTPADLEPEFLAAHAEQMRYSRGFGFWCWKPHLIRRVVASLPPEGVAMYCDSQCLFVRDPLPLLRICRKNGGVLVFHQRREKRFNREWTRDCCFEAMNCNEAKYWEGPQLNSAVTVWCNTPLALRTLDEMSRWVTTLDVVGDGLPGEKNHPEFRDHRHDQSIMSLLAIRDNLLTMPDPTQYGNGYEEAARGYPQILEINRQVSHPYAIPCQTPDL